MAKKKINISSKEIAELVVKGMIEKKGLEVVKLNLSKLSNAVCDYFIICHGTSNTHVEAIADSIINDVNKESGNKIDGVTVRIIGTDGTNLKMRTKNGKFQLKLLF